MKIFKKFCSMVVTAAVVMTVGVSAVPTASAEQQFDMPCFLSSGALFQQNKPIHLWGKATAGNKITAKLSFEGSTEVLDSKETVTANDGTWSLELDQRAGSFDKYAIKVYDGETVAAELSDILIGELWIGTGQSNMQFNLRGQVEKKDLLKKLADGEKYDAIRVLDTSRAADIDAPSEAGVQFDTLDCKTMPSEWHNARDTDYLCNISAYGVLTSVELFENINVPVGFINATIGSTGIEAWMSPDAVGSSKTVINVLKKHGKYTDNPTPRVRFDNTSGSWNTRLGPLSGLNVAGFTWYQGCSNLEQGLVNNAGFYEAALDAFINDLAGKFRFESVNDMPFIMTQLAPDNFAFTNDALPIWTEEVARVVNKYPLTQQITFYDASLVYHLDGCSGDPCTCQNGIDHPSDKRTISHRTAQAMLHNVYKVEGTTPDYYIPEVESYTITDNGKIIVTFKNVGEGLSVITGESTDVRSLADSDEIEGFTVCGENHVYTPARAKIISKNQVMVYSPLVKTPVAFTYAFTNFNVCSDLCNSYGLPALQYRSHKFDDAYNCTPLDWASCDQTVFWDTNRREGYYVPNWTVGGIENYTDASSGTVKVNSEIRMQGQGSVQFDYTINASTRKRVSVGPTFESMWYLPNGRLDMYDTLTVYIKNPDNRKKNVSLVAKHIDSGKLLHIAAADGTNTVSVGYKTDFTGYVFDLSKVTDDEGNPIDKDWLSGISGFQFLFNDLTSGTLYFDCIELGFEAPAEAVRRIATEQVISKIADIDLEHLTAETRQQLKSAIDAAKTSYDALIKDFPDGYATNYELIALGEQALARRLYGDLDGNGSIEATDALWALQAFVGSRNLDEDTKKIADVDGSGEVDASDALNILQKAVGLRDKFAVEE